MSEDVLLQLRKSVDNVIYEYDTMKIFAQNWQKDCNHYKTLVETDRANYLAKIKTLEVENEELRETLEQCQTCSDISVLLEELYDLETEITALKAEIRRAEKIAGIRLDVITSLDGGAYKASIQNIDRG